MQVLDEYAVKGRAAKEEAIRKALVMRDQALQKVGMKPEDLDKLNQVPMIVAIVGAIINLTLLVVITNTAWMSGTALKDGQPFTAHLSLTSVQFGPKDHAAPDLRMKSRLWSVLASLPS